MNYRIVQPMLYNQDITSIEYDSSENPTVIHYSNGQDVIITYKSDGSPDIVKYFDATGQVIEQQQFNSNTVGNLLSVIKQQGGI